MHSFYFHGLPGSAGELALFGERLARCGARMRVVPRNEIAAAPGDGDLFDAMARWVDDASGGEPVELVGFSLGGAAALRVAARLEARVSRLQLISAAAPLDLGDYLQDMAGAAVFRAAAHSQARLSRIARWQALAARIAPQLMVRALLASARGEDRLLRRDARFTAVLAEMVQDCLVPPADSYLREIALYAQPWRDELLGVKARVDLWHGTHDNWSPPQMAADLAAALPDCQPVRWLEGCSHYSTLAAWLDRRSNTGAPAAASRAAGRSSFNSTETST